MDTNTRLSRVPISFCYLWVSIQPGLTCVCRSPPGTTPEKHAPFQSGLRVSRRAVFREMNQLKDREEFRESRGRHCVSRYVDSVVASRAVELICDVGMHFCRTFESDSTAEVLEGQMHSGVRDLVFREQARGSRQAKLIFTYQARMRS
jgi:hypothetical protein